LREAAGGERSLLDRQLIDHISSRGVHLVHERRADDVHRRCDRTDPEIGVDSSGSVAIDDDLAMAFRVETALGKRQFVLICAS
jgi:hypothetical protein